MNLKLFLLPAPALGMLFLTASFLPVEPVSAQPLTLPNSNADRFTQPIPTPQPLPAQTPAIAPAQSTPAQPEWSSTQINISQVEITGNTVLKAEDLKAITQKVEGKTVTFKDLKAIADSITQLYLDKGYITSRAVLENQTIQNGVVTIKAIEGSVEKIEVEGLQRLNPNYVTSRIKLGTGSPLSKNKLEDQLLLLKGDPLFEKVEASIRPGSGLGQSILVVRLKESKAVSGFIGADNYAPASLGAERLGTGLTYRNVTGVGDEFSASYYRSIRGGLNAFDLNYRVPINPMNGTIQVRVAPSRGKIVDDQFSAFDIRSKNDFYEISYRQPVIRTTKEELALSLGLAIQNGQTFLFQDTPFPFGIGPDADGKSNTRVLKFGQDYIKRDVSGAWALRSQFNFGLNMMNATANDGDIPDGQFFSWTGQVQRVQKLSENNLLVAQAEIQLSPDSLLPSQQFVVGGGQQLRGYRQNARSGDNGFRVSIEDQITVSRNSSGAAVLTVAPFVDFGTVWNNPNNPNRLPDQNFLASGGLGIVYQPTSNLTMRLDYGMPFVKLDDRGNNAQDKGFYFSTKYTF
jgi:hemolysin activation/secretion protein